MCNLDLAEHHVSNNKLSHFTFHTSFTRNHTEIWAGIADRSGDNATQLKVAVLSTHLLSDSDRFVKIHQVIKDTLSDLFEVQFQPDQKRDQFTKTGT